MATQKSPVRQLAWDYYSGKAGSLEEYRDKRRRAVEAVIAGKAIQEMSPPDAGQPDDSDSTDLNPRQRAIDPSVNTTYSSPSKNGKKAIPPVVSAAVVVLVVVGLLIYSSTNDDQAVIAEREALAESPLPSAVAPEPPEELVAALTALSGSDFEPSKITTFIKQWNVLTLESQSQIRKTPQLLAYTEQVAQKSKDLLTLAGAGASISEAEKHNLDQLMAVLDLAPVNWPVEDNHQKMDTTLASHGTKNDHDHVNELPSTNGGDDDLPRTKASIIADATITAPPLSPTIPKVSQPVTTAEIEIEKTERTASIEPSSSLSSIKPRGDKTTGIGAEPSAKTAPTIDNSPQPPVVSHQSRPASIVLSEREGCSAKYAGTRSTSCADFLSSKIRGPKMVILAPGKFLMGDPRRRGESPQIEVAIAYTFGMSAYEITERDYFFYCKNSKAQCPQRSDDSGMPVVGISWKEAMGYTEWLSGRTGKNYRLPTEAEWEFAARGGSTSQYPFGDRLMITQARYSQKNSIAQGPLSTRQPINANSFGLYHTVGNVREWVADHWQDHHDQQIADGKARTGNGPRVVRGGSYADYEDALRSSARQPLDQSTRDRYTGFRVVLELPAE